MKNYWKIKNNEILFNYIEFDGLKRVLYCRINKIKLVVQLVNNKYIFIKMESMCQYIAKKYKSINELKEDLCSYNLPIDNSNFFVKKAEIILKEVLNR